MTQLSIHLPARFRLDLNLVKGRGKVLSSEPIFPTIAILRNLRRGSKTSRFFRHFFEKVNIKRIFGANLALMLVSSSVITTNIKAVDSISDVVTTQSPIVFVTEHSEIKFPTNPVRITQKYSFFHPGIDLDGFTGDLIYPIANGVVVDIQRSKVGYGNSILINHGGDVLSLYAHLSKINVSLGQIVDANTIIGLMGATGRAYGDHLHLEVYQGEKRINPLTLLK